MMSVAPTVANHRYTNYTIESRQVLRSLETKEHVPARTPAASISQPANTTSGELVLQFLSSCISLPNTDIP